MEKSKQVQWDWEQLQRFTRRAILGIVRPVCKRQTGLGIFKRLAESERERSRVGRPDSTIVVELLNSCPKSSQFPTPSLQPMFLQNSNIIFTGLPLKGWLQSPRRGANYSLHRWHCFCWSVSRQLSIESFAT